MHPPARPVLKPALRRLARGAGTVQLGLHPRHAVVVAGLDRAEIGLLDLLDGTRDDEGIAAAAQQLGVSAERARQLVTALARAGALDDAAPPTGPDAAGRAALLPDLLSLSLLHPDPGAAAAVLARRRRAAVTVHGAGRVGATVATLLAASGVGRVDPVDRGPVRTTDVSPAGIPAVAAGSRGEALRARLRRTPEPAAATALAVVAPVGSVAAPETLAAVRELPHLLVAVRETSAVVGPFVQPGRTPCVRCVELARADRDPGWPALAAQLAGAGSPVEPCDVVLATLAGALAALHALTWVDGGGAALPPSAAGIVEFDLADGRLRRRSVAPHPACGCGAGDRAGTMTG